MVHDSYEAGVKRYPSIQREQRSGPHDDATLTVVILDGIIYCTANGVSRDVCGHIAMH